MKIPKFGPNLGPNLSPKVGLKLCKTALFALLFTAVHAHAGRMLPAPLVLVLEPGSKYTFEKAILKTPIFEITPFSSLGNTVVPGFADPLGIGVDPQLRAFAGAVHFMDVLGDFSTEPNEDVANIELPPGALNGLDYRDNLIAPITSGKQRAYDASLLDVKKVKGEGYELNGVPVTDETSPLSLAGFGVVSEFLIPIRLHWTLCPSVEKRARVLGSVPRHLRKKYKPRPNTCFNI